MKLCIIDSIVRCIPTQGKHSGKQLFSGHAADSHDLYVRHLTNQAQGEAGAKGEAEEGPLPRPNLRRMSRQRKLPRHTEIK